MTRWPTFQSPAGTVSKARELAAVIGYRQSGIVMTGGGEIYLMAALVWGSLSESRLLGTRMP